MNKTNSLAAIFGLIALYPGMTLSEGAVRILDCAIVRTCDAAGSCQPGTGGVIFRMEPRTVGPEGAGGYTLTYGDTQAEMEARSPAGPFLWTVGSERDALIASSDSQFLWHTLKLDPAPEATVRFLKCTFNQ